MTIEIDAQIPTTQIQFNSDWTMILVISLFLMMQKKICMNSLAGIVR